MRGFRRHHFAIDGLAWLAALMLLLAPALVPALWRLQAAADPLAWVQVCTSNGLMQAQPGGEPMPNPAERAIQRDGDRVALQAPTPMPLAAEVTLALPAQASTERPCARAVPARPLLPWACAQARAPPAA